MQKSPPTGVFNGERSFQIKAGIREPLRHAGHAKCRFRPRGQVQHPDRIPQYLLASSVPSDAATMGQGLLRPWVLAAFLVSAVTGARESMVIVKINTGKADGDGGILSQLERCAISTRLWGGAVVVDVGARAFFRRGQDYVKHHLWGEAAFPCRALLLDLTGNATRIFRFLETSGVSLYPEMRTVLVGPQHQMEAALQHPSLRNAIHAVYLALKDGVRKDVFAYRRCLYCDHGEMGVQVLEPVAT
ncbi:uncharacterized protein LOC119568844 [Penaeus monodon]|uniref:uncharacterized protein LOC119568844 n=1 Tax=Penaeus monodon TaxID=6687 RepID=UPI0018A7A9A7|nr:uncharacterized protein LOC119568844 [Penaeus monodon]